MINMCGSAWNCHCHHPFVFFFMLWHYSLCHSITLHVMALCFVPRLGNNTFLCCSLYCCIASPQKTLQGILCFIFREKESSQARYIPKFPSSWGFQVTMALTPAKAKEAFDHVVNVIFQVPKGGLLYKALMKSGDNDIMAMIILLQISFLLFTGCLIAFIFRSLQFAQLKKILISFCEYHGLFIPNTQCLGIWSKTRCISNMKGMHWSWCTAPFSVH